MNKNQNDMYTITIFNHVEKTYGMKFHFENKRKANKFLKDFAKKIGYDYYKDGDQSTEYIRNY